MRKKEIEEKLNIAFSDSTPDVLDKILTKCERKKSFEKVDFMRKDEVNKKRNLFNPRLVGVFGAVVLVVGIFGFGHYNMVCRTDSVVEFDVNPSIEMNINKNDDVIGVVALNKDGEKILEDMDFDKVDLDIAVNALIGSMLKNGYLSIDENSILVSVKNDDVKKADMLKNSITNEISSILSANKIEGAILSQTYDDDKDVKKLADKNNVSEGKVKLINRILDSGIKGKNGNVYTFESLAKLSINELNTLLESKNANLDDVQTMGNVSQGTYIGKDKALDIAYDDAGVNKKDVVRVEEVEFDCDDGRLVYEIEFKTSKKEYEYEVHATSGEIIKRESDRNDDRYDGFDD